jgi:lysophospholipid acyltransferase 1/2
MMIMTQKLTAFAFAYYDGMVPIEKLNGEQISQRIVSRPHIIQFLSYCFNFQGVVVGPLCYYEDYINYIDGSNITKKEVAPSTFNKFKNASLKFN